MRTNRLILPLIFVAFAGCSKKTPDDLCAHEHELAVAESNESSNVKVAADDVATCKALMSALQDKAPVTYKCLSRCIPSAKDMAGLLGCEFKCGQEGRDAGEKLAEIEKESKPKPDYDPSQNDVDISFGGETMKVKDAFAAPAADPDDAKKGWYEIVVADTLEPEGCEGIAMARESKRSLRIDARNEKGEQIPKGLHAIQFTEKTGKNSAASWSCNEVDGGSIEMLKLAAPGKNGKLRVTCKGPKNHDVEGTIVFRTCPAQE